METLAHYQIGEKLGEGGMGVVYRAQDTRLNRPVAIKVLRAEAVANPERKKRFIREAQAASALNHPGIITIYDIGNAGGLDFIAMEYVEGRTLDQLIGRGLRLSQTLKYAALIADAVAAAHEAGIVHRDLKPANLMVTAKDQVKVLDFGLAKLSEPVLQDSSGDPLQPTRTMDQALRTEEGVIVGTVAYMSPEQAEGKKIDSRSDIFSFGSVLYEMVTGRRPFQGETRLSTLSAILNREPQPVSELVAEVPRELERLIHRCLQKDLTRRAHHMMDLKLALEELREESESGRAAAPEPGPGRRRRPAVILATALVLVAATAAITWWLARSKASPRAPELTQLTFDSGLTTDPALSPDGKLVAFASDRTGAGNLDIWRQQVATGEAIRLTTDPADESEPAFSPDGSRIAFRSERQGGGIYVVSSFGGGEPRLLAREGRRPRFSPDGARIAYWVGAWFLGKVFVAPSTGGAPTLVQPEFSSAMYPVWSSDGKHLLFLGARSVEDMSKQSFDWWTAPGHGGPAAATEAYGILRHHGLASETFDLVAPADWVGDHVLFSTRQGNSTNLWRLSVSPESRRAAGAPLRLTSGTSIETNPSAAAGGGLVFASLTTNLNLWNLPVDADRGKVTGEIERLTHAAFDAGSSLSADGSKLVFLSTRSGNPDVWMKDLVSGRESAITTTPVNEEQPELTPDGTRISYMIRGSRAQEGWPLYVVDAGAGIPEKVCEECFRNWDWSPDGRKILFLFQVAPMTLGLLDVDTRQKRELLRHPTYQIARARFSPDGGWISFTSMTSFARSRIAVVPFRENPPVAESERLAVSDDATWHDKGQWSPDGNLLYFTSDRDGYRCVRARRLDPVTKRPVGEVFDVYHSHNARRSILNAGTRFMDISVAPGRLVFNLEERTGNIWMAKPD